MKFLPCGNIIKDSDLKNIIANYGRCSLCNTVHDLKELENEETFFVITQSFVTNLDQQLNNLHSKLSI
jgi:hypothetical protein